MGDTNADKKEINENMLYNSSQKRANKIHLELLTFTKEEINKRTNIINNNKEMLKIRIFQYIKEKIK